MRSTDCSGSLMALGAWLVEMCKPRRVSSRWRRNGRSGSALPKGCRVISPHPRVACRSRGTHAGLVVLANSHRQALSVLRDCDSVTSARFPGEERCCIAQKSFFTRASSRLSEAISHSHGPTPQHPDASRGHGLPDWRWHPADGQADGLTLELIAEFSSLHLPVIGLPGSPR